MHSRQPTSLVISRHYCYKKFILLNDDSLRIFENRMCFTVQLSRFFGIFHCLATAHLVYHVRFCLSRTFLSFFKTFSNSFVISLLISNSFTLPHSFLNVKHFFEVFLISFQKSLTSKRRRRDLNPRAGYPTYTLSRGTSSAS